MPNSPSACPTPHAHPGKEDRADAMHAITAAQPAQTGQPASHDNDIAAHAKPPPGTAQPGDAMNRLLDAAKEALRLPSDAALSRALDVNPWTISNMRHHRSGIRPAIQMRLEQITGQRVDELEQRALLSGSVTAPGNTPAYATASDSPVSRLLDAVKDHLHLRSDGALSSALGVAQSEISKLRHHRRRMSAMMLMRLRGATGWSADELNRRFPDGEKLLLKTPTARPPKPDDPMNRLLDAVKAHLHLKSDAALSSALGVEQSAISRLRHRRLRMSAAMLTRLHQATGWSADELKRLFNLPDGDKPPRKTPAARKMPTARTPKPDNPVNRLLDTVKEHLHLKNDAALSAALGVAPPFISKLRHHQLEIRAGMLIRLHEVTGWRIRELKHMLQPPAEPAPHSKRLP